MRAGASGAAHGSARDEVWGKVKEEEKAEERAWGVNVSLLRGQRSANGRRVAEHPGKRAGAEADGENRECRADDDLRNLVAGASQKPRTGRGKSGFPSTPPPLAPATSFPAPRLFLLAGRSGRLRIFPESPRRILCAAAPPQFPAPCLVFSSSAPASPCASLCSLFFPPRAVPPTSHPLVASFRLGPRLSCLPFPFAPRFPRRPPLCPMVLAALSLSATGFASHAFFPPCATFRRVLIPACPPLPARFLSLVLRLSCRAPAPFDENRPQPPCAQSEAMRVQGI